MDYTIIPDDFIQYLINEILTMRHLPETKTRCLFLKLSNGEWVIIDLKNGHILSPEKFERLMGYPAPLPDVSTPYPPFADVVYAEICKGLDTFTSSLIN